MNVRDDPVKNIHPLQSKHIDSLLNAAHADCVRLIGLHSPSGTVLYEGLYDVTDERLDLMASGLFSEQTTGIPDILQMDDELQHIREG
jgi:hypothetical protein